jgi:aconitate decarboxylase
MSFSGDGIGPCALHTRMRSVRGFGRSDSLQRRSPGDNAMTDLTSALARFASSASSDRIPDDVAAIIRTGFIDATATMLAGRSEPVVEILREHLADRLRRQGESSVLFGAARAAAADAALINGTATHALDYDDVALAGHPSTVLVPALLAEGEALGASGARIMRAYLVGYEVWADLISRDEDPHHTKGWHPTAVFGTVAAAAAIAALRAVPFDVARHAIALSGSMAGGLVSNFGTMTKPYHAGRAASGGIEAVRLAMRGMTAAPDALEHHAGFLNAISPRGRLDLERSAERLGTDLRILESGLSIKQYPICYATHRVIDGVLDIARRERLDAEQVDAVSAQVGRTQASMLRNHAPQTGLEAKFSLEFAVASSLVAREVGLAQLTDAFVGRPEIQRTMKKVTTTTVDTSCPVEPMFAFADRVQIKLRDGRTIDSGDIRFARGNAQLPLTSDELKRKFMDCVSGARDVDAQQTYRQLAELDSMSDVRTLTASHR